MEVNILVGGAAGQGMDTVMNLLGKALVREGYELIYTKDYMSRVRGGHNFSRLRIGAGPPWTNVASVDILLALNEETYLLHRSNLAPSGRIIYDPQHFNLPEDESRGVPVELQRLAVEAGGKVMANTVAVGALLVLIGLDNKVMETLLQEAFVAKAGFGAKNIAASQGRSKNGVTIL